MSNLAPGRDGALVIRAAAQKDAASIAKVHVQSWRETYQGMMPDAYLDGLSAAAHERQWRRTFAGGGWAFVAEWHGEIVGFASGGLSRGRKEVTGELFVLYVLERVQQRGIGRALFDACHYELARRGHQGLVVWVLADNPARAFYEHLGGRLVAESQVTVGGKRLREVAYLWTD